MGGGFGLAADAISRAFSDTFKGMNEGEEERRKEEALGIKQREAITEQAYQPIRFEAGKLANQATVQNMDLARQQNQRAWNVEGRAATAFGPEQSLRESQAAMGKVDAQVHEQKVKNELDLQKAQLAKNAQDLKEAETSFPYLKPRLENERKVLEQSIKTNEFKYGEMTAARGRRDKAGAALLAAGTDVNQIARVLAQYGGDIEPNDPYVRWLLVNVEGQLRAAGDNKINPLMLHRETENTKKAAIDDADRRAERELITAYGPQVVKEGIEPGLDEARAWYQQYHYARSLMSAENPQLGIKFSASDKQIQPMPDSLIKAHAKNPGLLSSIFGTPAGYDQSLDVYSRANAYLTQGYEWSRAVSQAARDNLDAKKGVKTLSDGWAAKTTTMTPGTFLEDVRNAFSGGWGNLGANISAGKKSSTTEPGRGTPIELPPATTPGRDKPEQVKRDRLNELAVGKWGMTYEEVIKNGDERHKAFLDQMYSDKYGSKP